MGKQEEMDKVSRQMEGLQDILGKLAEEIARMKTSSPGADGKTASSGGSADNLLLQKQVCIRVVMVVCLLDCWILVVE